MFLSRCRHIGRHPTYARMSAGGPFTTRLACWREVCGLTTEGSNSSHISFNPRPLI